MLTTYLVESVVDDLDHYETPDSVITLRAAIEAANRNGPVGDAPAGQPAAESLNEILLSASTETIRLEGTLVITEAVSIPGDSDSIRPVIRSRYDGRHFQIQTAAPDPPIRMSHLSLQGGVADFGAAIQIGAETEVVLDAIDFRDNWANGRRFPVRNPSMTTSATAPFLFAAKR